MVTGWAPTLGCGAPPPPAPEGGPPGSPEGVAPGWSAGACPVAAGPLGVMWTPGRAEASVPPCGFGTWQSPDVHWFPGIGALKCSTVRDMLAARNAATTTPRPAANVGVITSLRNAGLTRLALGRTLSGRSRPACSCAGSQAAWRAPGAPPPGP